MIIIDPDTQPVAVSQQPFRYTDCDAAENRLLESLINLASPDDYQKFVYKLAHNSIKATIGAEADSAGIALYHKPFSRILALDDAARSVRKIGGYCHVRILEFVPRCLINKRPWRIAL